MVDSEALLLGWAQDDTEKMWGAMVRVMFSRMRRTHQSVP